MPSFPEKQGVHLWRTEFPVESSLSLKDQKNTWRELTHLWIKETLQSNYGLTAEQATVSYRPSGQPVLENLNHPLNISISHSFELSSFALTSSSKLGVDLEKRLPRKNLSVIWKHLKVSNDEQMNAHRFYTIWTQLEAYTKALGSSIWQTQWAAEYLMTLNLENSLAHGQLKNESWYFYTDETEQAIISIAINSHEPLKVTCFKGDPPT